MAGELSLALFDLVWARHVPFSSSHKSQPYFAPAFIKKLPADALSGTFTVEFFTPSRPSREIDVANLTDVQSWTAWTVEQALAQSPDVKSMRKAISAAVAWSADKILFDSSGRQELRAGMRCSCYDPTRSLSRDSWYAKILVLQIYPGVDSNATKRIHCELEDDDEECFSQRSRRLLSKPRLAHPSLISAHFECPIKLSDCPFPLDRSKHIFVVGADGVESDQSQPLSSFWLRESIVFRSGQSSFAQAVSARADAIWSAAAETFPQYMPRSRAAPVAGTLRPVAAAVADGDADPVVVERTDSALRRDMRPTRPVSKAVQAAPLPVSMGDSPISLADDSDDEDVGVLLGRPLGIEQVLTRRPIPGPAAASPKVKPVRRTTTAVIVLSSDSDSDFETRPRCKKRKAK